MDKQCKAILKCVFCGSTFPKESYQPQENELIKCSNCGRENDFSSIKGMAVTEKLDESKKEFVDDAKKKLKEMLKKYRK